MKLSKNFNKREFSEELVKIDWSDAIDNNNGTNESYQFFYYKIELAPYRKMTKYKLGLSIGHGLHVVF